MHKHCSDEISMASDKFLNEPERVKELEDMGYKVTAKDLQEGFVPIDKFAPENLEEVEDNIQKRFSL